MTSSIGYTDARPLQVRVADDIRLKIESGEYAPGQQLPTLDELAALNLCSLAVIRKSLDLLRQQGLVVTVQGKGSFVRERPSARRHGIDRYARSKWKGVTGKPILIAEAEAQGRSAGQQLRELAEVPAPESVAEKFGVPAGTPVWVRRRTTLIDNRPNQLADSYYPLDIVTGTPIMEEDTGPGGGFARLEDAGHTLDRIREEWAVRMPTGPESVALRLQTGTPVVDLLRTTYDAEGRAVEVMLATLAGDMVTFAYEFPIPD
ncbi:GntR family transcriptional regulator [Longispora albida]|uniref:GntR family transcriptional regulator n=1 Tax=Longispora albida TaxID=203523 RepID=UPI000374CA12|nr:GntR family transcriptional regulator [Longispora albida]